MELKCSLFIYVVVLILLGHSIIALHGGMNVKNTDETNLWLRSGIAQHVFALSPGAPFMILLFWSHQNF